MILTDNVLQGFVIIWPKISVWSSSVLQSIKVAKHLILKDLDILLLDSVLSIIRNVLENIFERHRYLQETRFGMISLQTFFQSLLRVPLSLPYYICYRFFFCHLFLAIHFLDHTFWIIVAFHLVWEVRNQFILIMKILADSSLIEVLRIVIDRILQSDKALSQSRVNIFERRGNIIETWSRGRFMTQRNLGFQSFLPSEGEIIWSGKPCNVETVTVELNRFFDDRHVDLFSHWRVKLS